MIETRQIGASDVQVTALGFGGGPIGGSRKRLTDAEVAATLAAAWNGGVRYFDTAPLYGFGESERRLGDFLRAKPRASFVLSSKVGRLLRPAASPAFPGGPALQVVYDYSRDGVMRSLEESEKRLGFGPPDIVLIHDVDRFTHGARQPEMFRAGLDGAYPALAELKAQGAIRAIGIGLNDADVAEAFVRRADIDCVLLAGRYTLLEQGAAESFLPLCIERKVSVIIGGPYNSGILATGPVADSTYNYVAAPEAVRERVARIAAVLAPFGVPMTAAALQYPLRHSAVASIIPGMTAPAEVAVAAEGVAQAIPAEAWAALRATGLAA